MKSEIKCDVDKVASFVSYLHELENIVSECKR